MVGGVREAGGGVEAVSREEGGEMVVEREETLRDYIVDSPYSGASVMGKYASNKRVQWSRLRCNDCNAHAYDSIIADIYNIH